MTSPLAVCLLVQDHERTVESTLESVLPLNAKIYAGSLSNRDGTALKCKAYGAEVIPLSLNDNYAKAKNDLLKKADARWVLFIEPWEMILRGHDEIAQKIRGGAAAHRVNILQGDVVTKEVRLWHKDSNLQFNNPVYETVLGDAQHSEIYFHSLGANSIEKNLDLILKWKAKFPLATEAHYYHACVLLTMKKWKEFLTMAEHYLFQEKKKAMSVTMTKYYLAMVYAYIEKNYHKAANYLIECIAEKPLMAEFWCLLGDIYYENRKYYKAREFYENALLLGGRRLRADEWPLEISKYKEYPTMMMDACAKIIKATTTYSGK